MATPLEIEIALHYHYSAVDYDRQRMHMPSVRSAIGDFISRGLLRRATPPSDREFEPTPGLAVYVEALCAVPFPVQHWVIPEPNDAARNPDHSDALVQGRGAR